MDFLQIIILILGIILGAILSWLIAKARWSRQLAIMETQLESERKISEEKLQLLNEAKDKLSDAFKALSKDALDSSNTSFLQLAVETLKQYQTEAKGELDQRKQAVENLVNPIKETLDKYQKWLQDIEKERKLEYGGLSNQIKALAETERQLQKEASNLTLALKAPQVRGSWGEHTLRRVVEMAGLVEYCDFGLQETVSTEEGRLRPDLIVRMPGERVIVVDAKNIFQKYYEAMGCEDEVKRNSLQNENVKNLRKHIKDLSSKGYWEQYGQSADFVVFFMPNENIFVEALRRDEDLFEDAIRQRILLTHPISLIGLLKIVAHSWSQMKLAENTEKIKDLGRELYERMSKFVEYFAKMGTNLSRTVESYNSAVGAFEGRVLPSARKFSELGIAAKIEIEMLEQVEKTPRTVQSSDLKGLSGRKNIELP